MPRPQTPGSPMGDSIQLLPASRARAQTLDSTVSTATTVTLDTGTSIVRFQAFLGAVYMKWLTAADTDAVTNANYEGIISDGGAPFDFVIPPNVTGVSLLEKDSGAEISVIEF